MRQQLPKTYIISTDFPTLKWALLLISELRKLKGSKTQEATQLASVTQRESSRTEANSVLKLQLLASILDCSPPVFVGWRDGRMDRWVTTHLLGPKHLLHSLKFTLRAWPPSGQDKLTNARKEARCPCMGCLMYKELAQENESSPCQGEKKMALK